MTTNTDNWWPSYDRMHPEFVNQHPEIVLQDVFNHVKAFLLFPPNCKCEEGCQCAENRAKVVLSLNAGFYQTLEVERDPLGLDRDAIRIMLRLPNANLLNEQLLRSYSLSWIEEEFKRHFEERHFQMAERLTATLLQLAENYQNLTRRPLTSLKEATEILLGDLPLKRKADAKKKKSYLGGEKAYAKSFAQYKSVCHFILALKCMKSVFSPTSLSLFKPPSSAAIETFLWYAHGVRERLLELETLNTKEKGPFADDTLPPLPPWVTSEKGMLLPYLHHNKLHGGLSDLLLLYFGPQATRSPEKLMRLWVEYFPEEEDPSEEDFARIFANDTFEEEDDS